MQTYGTPPLTIQCILIYSEYCLEMYILLLLIQVKSPLDLWTLVCSIASVEENSFSLCLEINLLGSWDYFFQKDCREKDKMKDLDYVDHKIYCPNEVTRV